jgi:serine/threonine protein kinase
VTCDRSVVFSGSSGFHHEIKLNGLGAVLYEMMYGLPPFYSRDTAEMYDNILYKPLRLRTNVSASARSILEGVSLLLFFLLLWMLNKDLACIIVLSVVLSFFHRYYCSFTGIIILSPVLLFFHWYYHSFTGIIVLSLVLSFFHRYYCSSLFTHCKKKQWIL